MTAPHAPRRRANLDPDRQKVDSGTQRAIYAAAEVATRYWSTMLMVILLGIGAAAAALSVVPPVYRADVAFYVGGHAVPTESPQTASTMVISRIPSYLELLHSDMLSDAVSANPSVAQKASRHPASREIAESVTATSPDQTAVIQVVVRNRSPSDALLISQAIASEFPRVVDRLDNAGDRAIVRISVLSPAQLQPYPDSPNRLRWLLVGGLAGLVAALATMWIRHALDSTLHTAAEVADLLGEPVLGVVERSNRLGRGRGNDDTNDGLHLLGAAVDRVLQSRSGWQVLVVGAGTETSAVARELGTVLSRRRQSVRLMTSQEFVGQLEQPQARVYPNQLVVVDGGSGPISASTAVAAAECGVVVVATTAGRTRVPQLRDSVNGLRLVHAKVIGGLFYR